MRDVSDIDSACDKMLEFLRHASPMVNPFMENYWKQFGGGPDEPRPAKRSGKCAETGNEQASILNQRMAERPE